MNPSGTESTNLSGIVATFTHSDTNETANDLAATITWASGQTSSGTIRLNEQSNLFEVSGSHTYVEEGFYVVGVSIWENESGGNTASVSSITIS